MLKRKISKAEHTALVPALQVEYKAVGDDFELDAEGPDDVGELRRAHDREKQAVAAEKAKVVTLETQFNDIKTKYDLVTATDQRRAGDVAALDKSWKEKFDAANLEAANKLAVKDKFIHTTLVDSVATSMAAELSGDNAAILIPHIKQRLSADLSGETPLTRVIDITGKPTALSVEDLKKEFKENKQFASVIIASKASGGGAAGGSRNNGGAGSGDKKFKDMGDAERTEWFKRDPEGFKQAAAEARRVF